ncbi:response regulator [uncultured Flavobacterium sp.]|uniref:response regulator n=1 Tax=uncultured Flavobacterium sp. TaxID=165435 RepID=UPI0030EB68C7|tara:strand:+ start:15763 stop:16434 length:672 start_codon:yes stop_codon:yes gene_type:complete
MSKLINILVVDDHPMTTDAYINLIRLSSQDLQFNFETASDCETAFKHIEMHAKIGKTIDIAIIDIGLPPYKDEKITSGADIAKLVREKFEFCKVIILTMHHEALLLNDIFKSINPEGFLSKNDIDFVTFPKIFSSILKHNRYISKTIYEALVALFKQNISWDEYDSQIMLLLEKGIKTKELPKYIELSLSSIEKRKANIKLQLLDKRGTDNELIEVAKNLNLI